MKLSKAIELGRQSKWSEACARMNPGDTRQWYIMLVDQDEKSHMLVDDGDTPITDQDLGAFVPILREIGLKAFSVALK